MQSGRSYVFCSLYWFEFITSMAHRSQPVDINRCLQSGGYHAVHSKSAGNGLTIFCWGEGVPSFWFKTGISATTNFTMLSTGPLSVDGQLNTQCHKYSFLLNTLHYCMTAKLGIKQNICLYIRIFCYFLLLQI